LVNKFCDMSNSKKTSSFTIFGIVLILCALIYVVLSLFAAALFGKYHPLATNDIVELMWRSINVSYFFKISMSLFCVGVLSYFWGVIKFKNRNLLFPIVVISAVVALYYLYCFLYLFPSPDDFKLHVLESVQKTIKTIEYHDGGVNLDSEFEGLEHGTND